MMKPIFNHLMNKKENPIPNNINIIFGNYLIEKHITLA